MAFMKLNHMYVVSAFCVMFSLPQNAPAQCAGDHECKGNRRCVNGECVAQPKAQKPAPTPAPVSSITPVKPRNSGGFRVGLKPLVGFNLSRNRPLDEFDSFMDDMVGETPEYSMGAGFSGGFAVDLRIGKIFSLEPGFLISSKKFGLEMQTPYLTYEGGYSFTWLQIPLAARFHLIPRGPVELIAFLGPVVGFNLGASAYVDYEDFGDEDFDLKDSDDTDADVSPVEFCMEFGIETGVRLGIGALFVNLALTPGLTSLLEYPHDVPAPGDPGSVAFDDRFTMGSFQVLLGYAVYLPVGN